MGKKIYQILGGDLRALLNDAIQSSRQALSRSIHWESTDTNIEDPDTENLIGISLLKRAERLAKQGLISKSASVLNQSPMAPATCNTFQQLQQLHPRREHPPTSAIPENIPNPPRLNATCLIEYIINAIKDSPKRSAPGLSGWRYEHLKWIIDSESDNDKSPIFSILAAIMEARLIPEIKEILRTTILLAILKPNGGVRPLSLADVLRRIVAKAVAIAHKYQWKRAVGIYQYGIATAAGVEAVQTGVKLHLQTNQESAAVLFDGVNAFNSCDRQMFLNELYAHFPAISSFIEQWYVGESPLWFFMQDGSIQTILSSEGSQQGDPDGSFLYCLGAAPCLQRIAHNLPSCYLGVIIDDLTVGTSVHNIPQVINIVSQNFSRVWHCSGYS